MDHALKMMRLCFEENFRVTAPWHTMVLAYGGVEPPDQRRVAMETDLRIANGLGRIILCGHKISRGMEAERQAVIERVNIWNDTTNYTRPIKTQDVILDLTGQNDYVCRESLQHYRRRFS